jgi:hypothetical protein
MFEVSCSSYPTKSTILTVVWFFVIRHPEIANTAMILSKLNATIDALVAADADGKSG